MLIFVEIGPQIQPDTPTPCNFITSSVDNHGQVHQPKPSSHAIPTRLAYENTMAYFLAFTRKRHDMKTLFIILVTVLLPLRGVVVAQNKLSTTKGYVSFFSKAPVADVDARNEKVKVQMNTSDGEVIVDITMTDFQFKNEKMGRDARKKYLEINKYPKASFKGKIQGKIDYDKPGSYNATARGKLKIHGVEKDVTEKGTVIVVEGGQVKLKSEFNVTLADYKIKTPKIIGQEMTDEKILVKIEATLRKGGKEIASKK
jgi:polyisoprenoid-binding protein YceI